MPQQRLKQKAKQLKSACSTIKERLDANDVEHITKFVESYHGVSPIEELKEGLTTEPQTNDFDSAILTVAMLELQAFSLSSN